MAAKTKASAKSTKIARATVRRGVGARSESGERLRRAAQAEIAERIRRLEDGEPVSNEAPSQSSVEATHAEPSNPSPAAAGASNAAKAKSKATTTKSEKPARPPKPKRVSALDAAAIVVRGSKEPMRPGEMVEAMKSQGLWSSPTGKTPGATLYAAIIREIARKGEASRFRKAERGRFVANARKPA